MKRLATVLVLVLIAGLMITAVDASAKAQEIKNGKDVKLDYTLFVNGQTIDNSEMSGPIEYRHGDGKLIPGLEKRLEGLKVGDKVSIRVPSDEAFGPVQPEGIREVPKSILGKGPVPQAGQRVVLLDDKGRKYGATVKEIRKDSMVLDMNHPLAGQDLYFDVVVLEVK